MKQSPAGRRAFSGLVLVALSTTLGMQTVRTAIPYAHYLLYARLGLHPVLAALALLPVLAAGLSFPVLARGLGIRRALVATAATLGLARAGMQIWQGDPVVDMVLAGVGAAAFFVLLPTLLAHERARSETAEAGGVRFAVAVALGLALDTALHGIFLTYDYVWRAGTVPLTLALALAAAHLAALALSTLGRERPDGLPDAALPWAAVGCFLFLQLGAFQNVARAAELSGRPLPLAFFCVAVGQAAGVLAATWLPPSSRRLVPAATAVLLASLLPFEGAATLASAVAGPGAAAVLLVRMAAGSRRSARSARSSPLSYGLAGLAAAGLVGALYAPQGIWVPYQGAYVYPLAGAIVALFAARAGPISGLTAGLPRAALSVAALLVPLAPLAVWYDWREPAAVAPGESRPVRILSYNVHKGFDARGHLDLEAIARTIEAEGPDVVALQEVTRGQLTEGSADMAAWLSRRLDLPCVYTPLGARLWGQAVFTRLPVLRAEGRLMPPLDLPTVRSYAYLELDAGWPEPLRLVNTHYTAAFGNAARLAHSEAVAADLAGRGVRRTVVAGDLNATPESPPVRLLFDLGLVDAIAQAGLVPGFTAPSTRPVVRIDYVLHSPDLEATDVTIGGGLASDHLYVAATMRNPEF